MMLGRDFFGVLEFWSLDICSAFFFFLMRQLWQGSEWLLQYGSGVAINSGEKHENSWNVVKRVITLHQEKRTQAAPQQMKITFLCVRFALSLHQKSEMIQFFDFMIRLNIMV